MREPTSSEGGAREPPACDRIYPWYLRKNFLVLAVCCVGPLALPLVWARPRTNPFLKTVLTIAIVWGSWMLWAAAAESLGNLREMVRLLENI